MTSPYINMQLVRSYKAADIRPLIAFLHPQRTGGTRLKKQMYEWFGRDAVYTQQTQGDGFKDWKHIEASDLEHMDAYAHHSDFWPKTWDRPIFYIGTIRHPVYRLVSFYEYCKIKSGHPLQSLARQVSPETFLVQGEKKFPKYFRDFQCLRFCRKRDARCASANIKKYFLGMSETTSLNRFAAALADALGLAPAAIEAHRPDPDRYDHIISEQFCQIARAYNPEDIKLFEWIMAGNNHY